jgi:hypothetical protein
MNVAIGWQVDVIGLQENARPRMGTIEHFWFENSQAGLARTLFHRIVIPLEPFDSGLEYVAQPESTEVVIEWINLGLEDPSKLDGVEIATGRTPDVEASIYIGGAHNWYHIERLTLAQVGDRYSVTGVGVVEFENEGVARNERFEFQAEAVYRGAA